MAGAGSAPPGQDRDRVRASVVMTASGPLPPADRASAEVVTAGEIVPLALRRRSGLRLSQRPLRRARTGIADSVRANLPSGRATVTEVGVVSAEAVTGRPLDRACLMAWLAVSGRGDAAPIFAACRGVAAWPGTAAAASVPATRAGAARTGMARREAIRRQRRSVGTPGHAPFRRQARGGNRARGYQTVARQRDGKILTM